MADTNTFQGLYTAIVTPFDEQKNIDKDAYEKHLDYQIKGGVDGLVVAGTTGESPTFSDEEFTYLLETAKRKSDGKIQIIAGSGSNDTKKSIHRSQLAKDAGADGLLVVSPYYNKPTQDGLLMHYMTIADSVDLPIMVYNVPGRTSVNIEVDTLVKMSEHDNIASVKEASGSIGQIMNTIGSLPERVSVLGGDDGVTLPLVALGGKGVVSVAANAAPGMMKDYVDAALSGDYDKARERHYTLLPLFQAGFLESNPIPIKYAMYALGRMQNELRLPLSALKADNCKKMDRVLKELQLI